MTPKDMLTDAPWQFAEPATPGAASRGGGRDSAAPARAGQGSTLLGADAGGDSAPARATADVPANANADAGLPGNVRYVSALSADATAAFVRAIAPGATLVAPAPQTADVSADFTPADPLYASQWHFALLGNIEAIWDEYSGAGVHVFIADDGVEYTHEDLAANYDASMHFTYNGVTYDPMPMSSVDGHGTSCSGLIVAEQGNGLGGTGVAWGATITGVNFLSDTQFLAEDIMLASLQWAENFDVMSNSWGITPGYASYQSPIDNTGNVQFGTTVVFEAISASGRGGLGTVIAQASGNDTRNAQGDAVNGTRFTVSVAATDDAGYATYYTNYGTCILIAAPAGAVTTDLSGTSGYSSGEYTDVFGGTSAATPITAGVITLMLEANSGLGWRDVHNILAISASQTGTAYGLSPSGTASQYEQGDWFSNGAINWNGGGMTFNLTYGYGMLNAYAAVRMAEIWSDLYAAQTSTNEMSATAANLGSTALTDNGTTTIQIDVTDNISIENIQVTVDLTHADGRELQIWLVGPDGTAFMLFDNEGSRRTMTKGFQWIFGVEAARGMLSAGTWEIQVIDNSAGNSGTFDGVTLDFYGSAVPTDDVHHITEDFLALATVDTGRAALTDAEKNHDTINMAVIQGDVDVNLKRDGHIDVGGVHWADVSATGTGGLFEDVITGDGNDSIQGNWDANLLSGMRGDDIIAGGNGNDTIKGGAGNDNLDGDKNDDLVLGEDGNDLLYGSKGNDTLDGGTGNDTLRGSAGNDLLTDSDGTNKLIGDKGNDVMQGGTGKDTLNGGTGNDDMTGGAAKDTFLFENGFGNDVINDFTVGEDKIKLVNNSAITDFADLSANHLSEVAGDTLITDGGDTITIVGVGMADLSAGDFVF